MFFFFFPLNDFTNVSFFRSVFLLFKNGHTSKWFQSTLMSVQASWPQIPSASVPGTHLTPTLRPPTRKVVYIHRVLGEKAREWVGQGASVGGVTGSWMFCEWHMIAYAGAFREGGGAPSVGNCYSDDNSNDMIEEKRKKETKGRCSLSITWLFS